MAFDRKGYTGPQEMKEELLEELWIQVRQPEPKPAIEEPGIGVWHSLAI